MFYVRFEGPVRREELLSRLRAVVTSNENCLEVARSERIERSLTQSIRREQDLAYLESLRQVCTTKIYKLSLYLLCVSVERNQVFPVMV
jgi:hypothetical protein